MPSHETLVALFLAMTVAHVVTATGFLTVLVAKHRSHDAMAETGRTIFAVGAVMALAAFVATPALAALAATL